MKNNILPSVMEKVEHDIIQDGIQKVVVGAVIIFRDNSPLVVRRVADDFMGGLVELPSGTVDAGEGLLDALVREVREETGLELSSIDSFIGSFDYLSGSGKKTRQVNFKATTRDNKVTLSSEHDAYYIVPVDSKEFGKLNISDNTRSIIINAFAF